MKKKAVVVLVLILALLLSMFSGCAAGEKEPGLLHICIDIGYVNGLADDPGFQRAFESQTLIMDMLYAGKEKNVEVPREFEIEWLPSEGVERETALERLRTEIMSGGGPDLFIAACNRNDPVIESEALFPMPEKTMELSVFMTLDDYMENNTYFTEWDRMNQMILSAGRTDEGQQIIPMCYTFPVAVYRAADAEHTPSSETTWMDMLESEDEALRAAAVWTDNTGNYHENMPFILRCAPMTEYILGALVDYEEEELLFTEEDLEQRLHEIVDLGDRYTAGEFKSVPVHYVDFVGRDFDQNSKVIDINGDEYYVRNGIDRLENYTMIPLYSDDGGVTAEITAYMAINRNADCPEDAYRVLDYLMSFSQQMMQNRTGLISSVVMEPGAVSPAIPMYNELMCEEHRPLSASGDRTGWYLTDENYAEFCEVREQITNVKFRNVLDKEFAKIYRDYYNAICYGGNPDKVVSDGYRKIQQMVRE